MAIYKSSEFPKFRWSDSQTCCCLPTSSPSLLAAGQTADVSAGDAEPHFPGFVLICVLVRVDHREVLGRLEDAREAPAPHTGYCGCTDPLPSMKLWPDHSCSVFPRSPSAYPTPGPGVYALLCDQRPSFCRTPHQGRKHLQSTWRGSSS